MENRKICISFPSSPLVCNGAQERGRKRCGTDFYSYIPFTKSVKSGDKKKRKRTQYSSKSFSCGHLTDHGLRMNPITNPKSCDLVCEIGEICGFCFAFDAMGRPQSFFGRLLASSRRDPSPFRAVLTSVWPRLALPNRPKTPFSAPKTVYRRHFHFKRRQLFGKGDQNY